MATSPRRGRKLVLDPDLIMNVSGSKRAEKRARERMLDDAEAGRVVISPRYTKAPARNDGGWTAEASPAR